MIRYKKIVEHHLTSTIFGFSLVCHSEQKFQLVHGELRAGAFGASECAVGDAELALLELEDLFFDGIGADKSEINEF